jgi:nucleoside-diphosphate-sugar epimerase
MSAAIGLGQLRRLDELLAKRAQVAAAYTSRLKIEGVTSIGLTPGMTRMSWFVYVVRIAPDISRDGVMSALAARGVPTRAYFPAIHLQPYYRERFAFEEGDFPVAEAVSRSTLALPFHANMTTDAVDLVVAALGDAIEAARRTGVPQPGQARGVGATMAARRVTSRRFERRAAGAVPPVAMAADAAPRIRHETKQPVNGAAVWRARHTPVVDIATEELLRRPLVSLPLGDVRAIVGGRRVVVTGAGGSIGSELCLQLAECAPASLVMVDRYENGLHAVAANLTRHAFARAVIGDVTDAARLEAIMSAAKPELVLHAAAHKHVPLMEGHPCEAVKNNVIGTAMVLDAAIRFGARQFVLISTDKAVRPSSVMGATKRAAELIVQRAALATDTHCVIVRFGNVLGSNGSVLHTFVAQARAGGPVTVTHPDVRRYFMLVSEAVHLVLHAAARAPQGSIAVLDIGEQIPIVGLAEQVIRRFGRHPEQVQIVFTGLRPGEKLSEELVGDGETLVRSDIPGIGCVAPPAGRDGGTSPRHLRVPEPRPRPAAGACPRPALARLLNPV